MLEEAQAGIKIARRNINNLRYADDTTLMVESEEELKSLFAGRFFTIWATREALLNPLEEINAVLLLYLPL